MICAALMVVAAAGGVLANTPPGFEPASETQLIVNYNGLVASGGMVLTKAATASQPQLATREQLSGTSYAVMMIDLDIPTNAPPATNTLLHWMQTGLVPATSPTKLNTTGSTEVYLLLNSNNVEAAQAYFGPSPPARVPMSHRYTQILVDTSDVEAQSLNALSLSAKNRTGFNALNVLRAAGLEDKVVAGNFFNVTNTTGTFPGNNANRGNNTLPNKIQPTGEPGADATNAPTVPAVAAGLASAGVVGLLGVMGATLMVLGL